MDVGNPDYWITKTIEYLMETKNSGDTIIGRKHRDNLLKDAITLLILARADYVKGNASNDKKKKAKEDIS